MVAPRHRGGETLTVPTRLNVTRFWAVVSFMVPMLRSGIATATLCVLAAIPIRLMSQRHNLAR
jgi:hypothetical protein